MYGLKISVLGLCPIATKNPVAGISFISPVILFFVRIDDTNWPSPLTSNVDVLKSISIFYSLNVSEKWTSSSILEISSKPSSGGGSSGLSSSGAISSLVGFSSPNKSDSPRAAILLKSKDLVKRLVIKEGVLENMFAFKSFDSINRTSKFKEEIYDFKTKKWNRSI